MKYIFLLLTALVLTTGAVQQNTGSFNADDFIRKYRESIIADMNKQGKNGYAVAVFDDKNIIWKECFGVSTYHKPVNDSMLFSIQSVSKNFTALAVMFAVQEGIVDLDSSVTQYLPGFTINSCFEQNPEKRITLRHLLTHTAGLTHEAPVGNNYDYAFNTFKDHWKSICDTWLKSPVGSKTSYSNLGFDLAAEILEKASGISYNEYLKTRIFKPLSMKNTTADDHEVLAYSNRTEGKVRGMKNTHVRIPLIGSGCIYTTVNDLINYVRFHMNFGKIGEKQLLDPKYFEEMYTYGFGTGVAKDFESGSYILGHSGGGFGFTADMRWSPDSRIACVVLHNVDHGSGGIYANQMAPVLLKDYLKIPKTIKKDTAFFNHNFKQVKMTGKFKNENSLREIPAITECVCDSVFKNEWKQYTGKYKMVPDWNFKWYTKVAILLGFKIFTAEVFKKGDALFLKSKLLKETKLKEYQPGMFFTNTGEMLDFRNKVPTYANIKIKMYKKTKS